MTVPHTALLDDEEENKSFYGCGSGSKITEDGKHVLNVYTKEDRSSDAGFLSSISSGSAYSNTVSVKNVVKTAFPVNKLSTTYKTWENRKTIFTNIPEGTECYRRVWYGTTLNIIKLTPEDLELFAFSQVQNSRNDDLFFKLPDKYTFNHGRDEYTWDLLKQNSNKRDTITNTLGCKNGFVFRSSFINIYK